MFKVTIAPRAEKEFAKLALNLKQKFSESLKNSRLTLLIIRMWKSYEIPNLAIASASVGGVFYLLYFQKKSELELLIFF